MLDDPPGYRNYWSAEYLDALPDEAIDAYCARADEIIAPSPTQHIIFPAIAWTREVCADVRPHGTGATYVNIVGKGGEERIVSGYGRENYERLAAVKAEYDPGDVFHLHHPIRRLAAG